MLIGTVNEDEAPEVSLTLSLGKRRLSTKGIVDTGFNGYISVPKRVLKKSNWVFLGFEQYELATGQIVREKVFLGKIYFDHKICEVYCVGSESNDVLIGTKLLRGKKLLIDFMSRRVTIEDSSELSD